MLDHSENKLVFFNGTYAQTDENNPDTDGDGLLDGEEVEANVFEQNGVVYEFYKIKSNPTLKDTDGDGIDDNIDPRPLVYTITDRTLSLVAGLAYSNLEDYVGKTVGYAMENGAIKIPGDVEGGIMRNGIINK